MFNNTKSSRNILVILLATFLISIGCNKESDSSEETITLKGTVLHGQSPIENSMVKIYLAGSSQWSDAVSLGETQTSSGGEFEISFSMTTDPEAVIYATASGASASIKLASVFGTQPLPSNVVINERTTIATAYAMAQFIDGDNIAGSYPGLQNAAATLQNLVNIGDGGIATVLNQFPNGASTSTLSKFNSLANIIATCVEQPSKCSDLFAISTSPNDEAPDNTLQAAINISHTPWRQEVISPLFDFSMNSELYEPMLNLAPDNWTLAIRYDGNGQQLDGPGNIAFDYDGNVWVTNNYTYSDDSSDPNVCGDTKVLRYTPTGENYPGSPYEGGGVYGAGFGITFDIRGDVWVGNFAFQGSQCPVSDDNQALLWNNVAQFNSNGEALSPDADLSVNPVIPGGYLSDEDAKIQGMASDHDGNIWMVNCEAESVTKFTNGDPNQRTVYEEIGIEKPFDVTVDTYGNAWVTSNYNDKVCKIDPNGNIQLVEGSFHRPMGIAADSQGNVWVANSGGMDPPCGSSTVEDFVEFIAAISSDNGFPGASVSMITPSGTVSAGSPYTGGGLYMPWGIAVDGNDNVFVANFNGKRLSYIAGANTSSLPPGFNTGDPISPDGGYTFDGFERVTGVQVDPSGNVWCCNNWEMIPVQTNPGSHQLVVFIGLAAPVETPLIGYPRSPHTED